MCSGFGGNSALCQGSDNGGTFLFPNAYNLPCSAPNVVSLAPPPAPDSAPAAAPGRAPAQAPDLSPGAAAVEVPVSSPEGRLEEELGLPGATAAFNTRCDGCLWSGHGQACGQGRLSPKPSHLWVTVLTTYRLRSRSVPG